MMLLIIILQFQSKNKRNKHTNEQTNKVIIYEKIPSKTTTHPN